MCNRCPAPHSPVSVQLEAGTAASQKPATGKRYGECVPTGLATNYTPCCCRWYRKHLPLRCSVVGCGGSAGLGGLRSPRVIARLLLRGEAGPQPRKLLQEHTLQLTLQGYEIRTSVHILYYNALLIDQRRSQLHRSSGKEDPARTVCNSNEPARPKSLNTKH